MIAYHGDLKVKEKYLSRVRAHREADQLIKGKYWEDGRGCAVGCTIHSSSHAAYETELGIPRILARLEDGIFESLPNGYAMEWPERFLLAIPVGADLRLVWPKFAIWLLTDSDHGVLRFAKTDKSRKAITDVADAYRKVIENNGDFSIIDWRKLRNAAAADAAAAAAAAAAAYAAAYTAYAAAAAGVGRTISVTSRTSGDVGAADAAAARSNSRIYQSNKLIELLSDAPVCGSARQ